MLCFLAIARKGQAQEQITLQEYRQMALEQNASIKILEDSVEIAELGVKRARSKNLPQVDGGVTGLYIGQPLNTVLPEYAGSVSGSVTQVIYAGGKVQAGIKAAETNQDIQVLLKDKTRADIILMVDSAYWNVVMAREQIVTLKQSSKYLGQTFTEVKDAYQAGTVYKNEVLEVSIKLQENTMAVQKAINNLQLAENYLRYLTGRDYNQPVEVMDSVPFEPVTLPADSLLNAMVNARPEVAMLEKSVELGEYQTQMTKANSLPRIGAAIYGTYGMNSSSETIDLIGTVPNNNTPILFGSNSMNWFAAVTVNIPIFHWGDHRNAIRQQELRQQSQQSTLQDTRKKIALEIQADYYALTESEKNVELTGLTLEEAVENIRLANDQMQAGTITSSQWLKAHSLWQQSYTQALASRVTYQINITQFQKAIGDL